MLCTIVILSEGFKCMYELLADSLTCGDCDRLLLLLFRLLLEERRGLGLLLK
jgi:hypothetical protein